MGKNTTIKRRDSRRRILKTGESQRSDGRYTYKYIGTDGKPHFIYSWRLEPTDPLPKGKRACISLREMEKEILRDKMDGIDSVAGKMTVCELLQKHNGLKSNVKEISKAGREQLMNTLKTDKLGNMSIDKVSYADAKEWAVRMKKKGYSYQTIYNRKRSLKAAFYTALDNDWVRKNPFKWDLEDVIEKDTVPKTPLNREEENNLLSFTEIDKIYKKHYPMFVILLNSGLRISELCGLTVQDIEFEEGFIDVNHQLTFKDNEYRVEPPKYNSVRKVPMSSPVKKAFERVIQDRGDMPDISIDGYSDFIFLKKNGYPMYGAMYDGVFTRIVKKYNKYHKDSPLPPFSPHTLRHTFCTNMANRNMPPKTLQYIMGHKNMATTFDYYAHGSAEAAKMAMDYMIAQGE